MTLDKLASALNQGGQHLGDIVYWTLAEARIDRSTLENTWSSAQLAPEFLPDPPTAEKALKAAVREAAVGQPDRLIRLGKEDEAEIVFAVVRETKHEDGKQVHLAACRIMPGKPASRGSSCRPARSFRTGRQRHDRHLHEAARTSPGRELRREPPRPAPGLADRYFT